MKNNKKADTIAGIIIAVFILSFALFWIVNVLDYNKDISYNYEKEIDLYILKSNSENILKKMDVSNVWQWEKFYINKNTVTKQYEVLTWSTNEIYKYIDKDWNNVNPDEALWKTFIREYKKNIDILRYDIKPPEINNIVFQYDAINIDWDFNSTLTDWWDIDQWIDLSNTTNSGTKIAESRDTIDNSDNNVSTYSSNIPTYLEFWINGLPSVNFDWDDSLAIRKNWDLNNNGNQYAESFYPEKTLAVVFKTSDDVQNWQIIYEQWWTATWYNFMIKNWNIWASIHNFSDSGYANTDFSSSDSNYYFPWDDDHKFKSVNLWEARPYTVYFITIVQDSSHIIIEEWETITDAVKMDNTTEDRYIDDRNKLKIYLNGYLVDETDHVDVMPEHSYAWIWNVFMWNVDPTTYNSSNETITVIDDEWSWDNDSYYFKWQIGELLSWNHALSENEVRWLQNYFTQKWFWGKKTIRHDIVDTEIKELKIY